MGGIWDERDEPDHLKSRGVGSVVDDLQALRRARRKAAAERKVRRALLGPEAPRFRGGSNWWAAFLTIEGVMAFITGAGLMIPYWPPFKNGSINNPIGFAGFCVMVASVVYMLGVGAGLIAYRRWKVRRELAYDDLADRAIARAADARGHHYEFHGVADEAEAELHHEHDRIALINEPDAVAAAEEPAPRPLALK